MKPAKPLPQPTVLPITPRLLAAAEAALGRRLPPGTRIIATPPPEPEIRPIITPGHHPSPGLQPDGSFVVNVDHA